MQHIARIPSLAAARVIAVSLPRGSPAWKPRLSPRSCHEFRQDTPRGSPTRNVQNGQGFQAKTRAEMPRRPLAVRAARTARSLGSLRRIIKNIGDIVLALRGSAADGDVEGGNLIVQEVRDRSMMGVWDNWLPGSVAARGRAAGTRFGPLGA